MATTRRPFGITLLMVLGVISGLMSILSGFLLVIDRDNLDLQSYGFHTSNQLLSYGIVALVIGVLQVLIALALGRGSEIVRILFAVIAVFNLGAGVWALVALQSEQRAGGAFTACASAVVLYLLFNHRAEDFFESAER